MRKVAKKVATKKIERLVVNVPFTLFNDLNEVADSLNIDRTNLVRMALREFVNKKKRELIETA